ncbi:MAG: amino acid ABC transporter permease [Mycobacteriales bacterium]
MASGDSAALRPGTSTGTRRTEAVVAVPVRHWGRYVSAAIVVGLLVALGIALSKAKIQYASIPKFLTSRVVLDGLRTTLVISVTAQAVGIALGVLFAVMRLSKNPVVSSVAWFYIWFFRGTPVLVQLVFWFNLALVFQTFTIPVPFTDLAIFSKPMNDFMTPFTAALLGLGLNEGAYMAEIVRAGIISVDEGQTEAAAALGMTSTQTMRRVVLPQAMRVIIPPTGNEFINMLKTSSLAAVVLLGELFRAAQNIYSSNLQTIELLIVISIWYLVLTTIASIIQYYIERRFSRGSSRDLPRTALQRIAANVLSLRRPGGGDV